MTGIGNENTELGEIEWRLDALLDQVNSQLDFGNIDEAIILVDQGLSLAKTHQKGSWIETFGEIRNALTIEPLHSEDRETVIMGEIPSSKSLTEDDDHEYNSLSNEKIEKVQVDPWLDSKYDYDNLTKSYTRIISEMNPPINIEQQEDQDILNQNDISKDLIQSFLEESNTSASIDSDFIEENIDTRAIKSVQDAIDGSQNSHVALEARLTDSKRKLMKENIIKMLKKNDYRLVPAKSPKFVVYYHSLDLIAFKHISVNETSQLFIFIPILLCPYQGTLLVEESGAKIRISNYPNQVVIDNILKSKFSELDRISRNIFHNVMGGGSLFGLINKYLANNAKLHKKESFLMIGDYKLDLIVNPLVICENKPHFIENHIIPFAYQKTMNIRFVKSDDLDNVLEFIEKKFYYIENYSESKGSINDLQQLEANFGRKLKYLTFPFTVFGAFILLAMLMQISVLLPMFLNLGLGALFVYCFFLILILIKYNKERKSLMRLISAPYIQNEQRFSEHNLLLIRSELTANQFSQFSYECFGKDTLSIFINELEESRVEPSEESGRDHNPESQNYLKFLQ